MSQQSVLKLLKKKKEWMTSKEISKILNITSASPILKKLFEQREILRCEIGNPIGIGNRTYEYRIK